MLKLLWTTKTFFVLARHLPLSNRDRTITIGTAKTTQQQTSTFTGEHDAVSESSQAKVPFLDSMRIRVRFPRFPIEQRYVAPKLSQRLYANVIVRLTYHCLVGVLGVD